jgi:hypoxanthine phosphoribosyltransferase
MTEYERILSESDLLCTHADLMSALDQMASAINRDYADKKPLVLCVMNGSVITAGHLLPRLQFPLEQDYIHASRYGEATSGGNINWKALPTLPLSGRDVILIEDIFDQGVTLKAIRDYCFAEGAKTVVCVSLLDKNIAASEYKKPEYIGLTIPDRYVFGFGLDKGGLWRNLPAIYAMKETD